MPRATHHSTPSRSRPARAAITAPEMPPPTPEEDEIGREISAALEELARDMQQRNLAAAVALAQQALAGRGPLVEHFAELGRRFGDTLNAPPSPATLKVIKGGRA